VLDFHPSTQLATAADPLKPCAARDCLVLQYHRVALLSHDPLRLGVQPCNFERHMEYLAENCNVISLQEMLQHVETGTPFRGHTVAVTFDAGYSDILYTAKEVLERLEIPATAFVPSASMIEQRPFWWDVLEDALIAGGLRSTLDLEIGGIPRRWKLDSQPGRFLAYADLYDILSTAAPLQQNNIVDAIVQGMETPGEDPDSHATMDTQELQSLENGGLITIGGYPHHGTNLSGLQEEVRVLEIGRNKQTLEEVLGHKIEYFAYPTTDDICEASVTARLLKGFGFTMAFCVSPDTVSIDGSADLYELSRVSVRDWNPFTFHKCIESFLG
jgi:peptidoglycan/xylan/chitin deacetylase (PgdA/CDA1 family)